jgi:ribosomal protein L21
MGKQYRTRQGQMIDYESLMAQHDTAVALGNMNLNARGDRLGRGGAIVQTRDQVVQEYYASSQRSVQNVSIKQVSADDFFETPQQALERIKAQKVSATEAPDEVPAEESPKKRRIVEKED